MEKSKSTENLLKSPLKPRYSDRFVPARAGKSWHITFPETPTKNSPNKTKDAKNEDDDSSAEEKNGNNQAAFLEDKTNTYSCLLKNEVLGYDYDSATVYQSPKKRIGRQLFHYDSSERPLKNMSSDRFSPYSTSPVSSNSQRILNTPVKRRPAIPKNPYKILDAPDLADDFYLNLIDWSSQDMVCVGLGTNIYGWTAFNAQVSHITDMGSLNDYPTSVKWNEQICGLKWSGFNSCLASGGNDNAVMLWNLHSRKPVSTLTGHSAAVKALAWSPHTRHVLATGGGTQDRKLKFWNAITSSCVAEIDTKSQVCNVAWSPHANELVSTHGYAMNHIAVWKYPSQKLVTRMTGHTHRVLYMALSPDGESVCTGASDETLRFWKVFEKVPMRAKKSSLDLFDGIR